MDIFTQNIGFDQSSLAIEKQKALLSNVKNSKETEKAKQTAQDFEAFFLTKTMESMFEGISTDGMFGGGNAEKIYRSFLLDEYGKNMAQAGGVGIADYVMNALLQVQEAQSAVVSPTGSEGE